MSTNELILGIKRWLYENYDIGSYIVPDISSEIIASIPSTSQYSMIKDHNGITLSFHCSSTDVNKDDIENAMTIILADTLYNHITDINLPYDELYSLIYDHTLIKSMFSVMYARGMSFSIVI